MTTRRGAAAEARRADILRAAAELFFVQGFERTTVRDIADRLGIQTGTVFYHFASKQALLEAVMHHGLDRALERVEGARAAGPDPVVRLAALFRAHLEALLDPETRYPLKVLLFEKRSLEPSARQAVDRRLAGYEALYKDALAEAAAAGAITEEPRSLRSFVFGALNWTLNWYEPDRGLDAATLVDRFVHLALKAAGARPEVPDGQGTDEPGRREGGPASGPAAQGRPARRSSGGGKAGRANQ
ncbi:MAG: TetR/AcrR family transcriptional regulator [Actinomycetia bacterium]|nr:TetR/AcrR family transcriptional regulator [Actinomycetes bacterium]